MFEMKRVRMTHKGGENYAVEVIAMCIAEEPNFLALFYKFLGELEPGESIVYSATQPPAYGENEG